MSDNLKLVDGRDDSKINVNQAHEVRFWTLKWGITPEQLQVAVRNVGPVAKDVRAFLNKSRGLLNQLR